MKLPYFADPANLVVEEEPQPDDPMLPDDMTAKQATAPTSSFSTTTASRQRIEGQLSDAKAQPSLASP